MTNNNLALPEGIILHGEAYDYKICLLYTSDAADE